MKREHPWREGRNVLDGRLDKQEIEREGGN